MSTQKTEAVQLYHGVLISRLGLDQLKKALIQLGLSTAGDRETLAGRLQRRLTLDKAFDKAVCDMKKEGAFESKHQSQGHTNDRISKLEQVVGEDEEELEEEVPDDEEEIPDEEEVSEEPPDDSVEDEEANDGTDGGWVVIHSMLPYTVAVGIYPTKSKAEIAYIEFLSEREGDMLKNAMHEIAENYPHEVDYEKFVLLDDCTEIAQRLYDTRIVDTFQDIISHSIRFISNGEKFEHRDYTNWDTESLIELVEQLGIKTFTKDIEDEDCDSECVIEKSVKYGSKKDDPKKSDEEPEFKVHPVEKLLPRQTYPLIIVPNFPHLPDAVYDQGMLLVDFMENLGMNVGKIGYGDQSVSVQLLPDVMIELDATISKKKNVAALEGGMLNFCYYHRFPVGPTWFVTASDR